MTDTKSSSDDVSTYLKKNVPYDAFVDLRRGPVRTSVTNMLH